MKAVTVNLPDSLAQKTQELAQKDGISVDTFVSIAVSEKVSSWIRDEDLQARAGRASREKFDRALEQVPDAPPVPGDEM